MHIRPLDDQAHDILHILYILHVVVWNPAYSASREVVLFARTFLLVPSCPLNQVQRHFLQFLRSSCLVLVLNSTCWLVQNCKLHSFWWGSASAWRLAVCCGADRHSCCQEQGVSARMGHLQKLHSFWARALAQLAGWVHTTGEHVSACTWLCSRV